MENAGNHYDEKYFMWQNSGAELGAKLNAAKFSEFITDDTQTVLDFGCGGGNLLAELKVRDPLGVEINSVAVEHARKLGIRTVGDLSEVPDHSVDLVISNHAVEHVVDPVTVFRQMNRVLKPGCLAVIVVPCDDVRYPYDENDIDFHLFSWSAGNLGNLAKAAGMEILESREYVHKWLPRWQKVYPIVGAQIFDAGARIYARLNRKRTQVRLVARKGAQAPAHSKMI